MDKALITSCSNKFFPSVLNLIGSIKKNYPDHPQIYVYDLDILPLFRKHLETITGVEVISMPSFCNYWKACYTWKPYIFTHPKAELNLYLDSGFQVLQPLDTAFAQIKKDDFLAVSQNSPLGNIAPSEFKDIFPVEEKYFKETYITAGIFGFKKDSSITPTINELFNAALAGLCLGFSPVEEWRNKGKNKNEFVRNCNLFRFDTSVLSLLMRKNFKDFTIAPQEKYELGKITGQNDQLSFNARLMYVKDEYIRPEKINTVSKFVVYFYVRFFIFLKELKRKKV